MATLATGKTWLSGDQVTPGGLNQMVNSATITGIVNAEIASNAGIQMSKLATGALPTGITVASANIVDGTIVNADISGVAGISHSKLAAVGAGQVLIGDAVTGTLTARTMTGDATLANNGIITIATGAVTSGKIADGAIVNADVNAAAGIAGSKIDPQFDSPATIVVNSGSDPALRITQTGAANALVVFDEAADATPFVVGPTGRVGIGTSVPNNELHVVGDVFASHASGHVFLDASAGAVELFGSSAFIDFKDNAADDYDCRIIQNSNGLAFETGGAGSASERVRINSSGNVGIGTNSPTSRVHALGDIFADDASGHVFLDASAGAVELFGSSAYIDFKNNAADDYDCRIIQNSNGLRIETGGNGSTAARMEVRSTGAVRFIPLAANPSSPEPGDVYYDSNVNKLYVYNGTSWVALH